MAGSSTTSETRGPRTQHLSAERLARKRAIDREAQRSSRSKTKNYIALLESRIEALTRVQSDGNTKELVDKIEEQRKENEALQATLRTIGKLVNSHEDAAGEASERKTVSRKSTPEEKGKTGKPDQTEKLKPDNYTDEIDSLPRSNEQNTYFGNALSRRDNEDRMDLFFGPLVKEGSILNSMPFLDYNQQLPSLFNQPVWRTGPDNECKCNKLVNFTNEVLGQFTKIQLHNTANQRIRDADIPIRAIKHGWNTVTKKYLMDPVWTALRHFDEVLLSKCATTERLVTLQHLCRLLRYRMNPNQKALDAMPMHLHERPSQRLIPHKPLADYLVWPGLRERVVFAPHHYCSEKFTDIFWNSFRFTGTHRFDDSYLQNSQTGLYQYSKTFEEQTCDLRHFCMTPDFFDDYPELRADIRCVDVILADLPGDLVDACNFGNIGEAFGMGDMELLSAGFSGEGYSP